MADHSKRTTVLLTVVAILFILTIIILCLPYDIGHKGSKGSPSTGKSESNKTYIETTTTKEPTTTKITKDTTSDPTVSKTVSTTSTSDRPVSSSSTSGEDIVGTRSSTLSTMSIISTGSSDYTDITEETDSLDYDDSTDGTDTSNISTDYTEITEGYTSNETYTSSVDYETTYSETETTTMLTETTLHEETSTMSSTTTSTSTTVSTTPMSTTPAVTTIDPFLDEPKCNKTQCKNSAANMWLLRDTNAEPCKNFYQYACGGAVDNKYLHPVDARDAVKTKILANIKEGGSEYNIARDFYKSCHEQDSMKAKQQWENTNYWMDEQVPVNEAPCDKDGLTDTLAKLIMNNFASLFDVSLDLDNSGNFVFRVTPPIYSSPFSDDIAQLHCLKQYKLDTMDEDSIDIEIEYQKYHDCKTNGTGLDARMSNLKLHLLQLNISQELSSYTLDFFKKASQLKEEPFTSNDLMQRDYKDYTGLGNKFNWSDLLTKLANQPIDLATTNVQVYRPEYLQKITRLLDEQIKQGKPICNILQTLWKETRYTDLVDPHSIKSTSVPYSEEYCLDLTTSLLPELLYSNETQVAADIEKVSEVRENIFNKTKSLKKQKDIEAVNQELQNFYLERNERDVFSLIENKENISSTKNYQEKSLLLLKRFRSILYTNLSNSDNDQGLNRLIYSTFEIAAFHPEDKYLLASYIEAPYYMEDMPAYMNYAGLGAAMARTALRTQQDKDQASSYTIKEVFQGSINTTLHIKMYNTSMESEAKVNQITWAGYQHAKNLVFQNLNTTLDQRDFAPLPWFQLSSTQLFYLKSAQMHCEKSSRIDLLAIKERGHIPGQIRVNKILVNTPKFRDAFSCSLQPSLPTSTTTASTTWGWGK